MDNTPTTSENNELIQPAPTSLPPQPMVNQSPPPTNNSLDSGTSAVDIVWQWITYGLWEWALISLATLLITTLTYYFDNSGNNSDYSFVIYVLAAMLCLLPLAFVSNIVYSRREANPKHGFSAVVMVLNAVFVFLATIGGLITFVVSVLSLFTATSPSTTTNIVIFSSIIVVVLSAMLFVRIINPSAMRWFTKMFPYIVLGVAGIAVVLAVVGPFRSQVTNRQDVLIETNLPTISTDIQTYVNDNSKLPGSLSDVDTSGDPGSEQLIKSNLVTYTPEPTAPVAQPLAASNSNNSDYVAPTQTSFSYKLCVTYKSAKGNSSITPVSGGTATLGYGLATGNHKAGYVCYSQTVTNTN